MRYYHDGGLALARVDCGDGADVDVFYSAPADWWQPKTGKWRRAGKGVIQAEVFGPSSYLDRIPADRVEAVQRDIVGRLV